MKGFLLVLLVCVSWDGLSQNVHLSDRAQFSIVTLGPDQEQFYEAFGHSAIRLYDPAYGIDYAYNYGEFTFNQPNFYLNFAKGHLNYSLGVQSWPDFRDAYIYYNRFVHEQVLNLNPLQKQKLFEFLQWNAQPENKYYLYDYFFNNCSTRIRDIVDTLFKDEIKFDQSFIKTTYTIRQLTDLYLQEQPWGDLGIDIGLGSRIDKQATPWEYMFLPDYLEYSFDHATVNINGNWVPLVSKKATLYDATPDTDRAGLITPWIIFGVLLLITLYVSWLDLRKQKASVWLDLILLFTTGFLGIVLCLLWFATDHHACAKNYNLLWALPFNLVVAFFIFRKQAPVWVTTYFQVAACLMAAILLLWWVLPQQINGFLYPFIIVMMIRYLVRGFLRPKKQG